MNQLKRIASLAFLAIASGVVGAQEPASATTEASPKFNFQDLIKRFDQDGDGQLSDAEREAAREAMPRRVGKNNMSRAATNAPDSRNEIVKRFDKNGDGVIDDEERAAARDELKKSRPPTSGTNTAMAARPTVDRQAVLREFDKDGDGKLSDEERQAAMSAMGKHVAVPGQPLGTPGQSPAAMLKRFDKNGDGQLDEDERTAMREEMQRRREQRRAVTPETQAAEPKAAEPRKDQ